MKPWARNRESRRRATRCSRWRWTRSAVSRPASRKATGRTGAFSRQSVSFWSGLRGTRSASSVASQPLWWAREGKSQSSPPFSSARRCSGSAPRISSEQERASRNAFVLETDPPARPVEQVLALHVGGFERVLALARGVEFLLGDPAAGGVEVRRFDLEGELRRVAVADAAPEPSLDVVLDHLRETAEFLLDRFGLPHQHVENAVLPALRQLEVAAAHLGRGLELAVNAPVALLDAARVPRQVEVEEVGAVGLEVQPLAGGVGGEQDAERVLGGRGVEPALDLAAAGAGDEAVNRIDALFGAVGVRDGSLQDVAEVALRALPVLGEDEDAAVVPAGGGAAGGLSVGREAGTEVLADPVEQPAGLRVG